MLCCDMLLGQLSHITNIITVVAISQNQQPQLSSATIMTTLIPSGDILDIFLPKITSRCTPTSYHFPSAAILAGSLLPNITSEYLHPPRYHLISCNIDTNLFTWCPGIQWVNCSHWRHRIYSQSYTMMWSLGFHRATTWIKTFKSGSFVIMTLSLATALTKSHSKLWEWHNWVKLTWCQCAAVFSYNPDSSHSSNDDATDQLRASTHIHHRHAPRYSELNG